MMEETGFSEKKLLMKEKYVRKSYGTIVQTRGLGLQSPSTISYIRHDLSPEDTLQGIALKYGVTVSLSINQSIYKCLLVNVYALDNNRVIFILFCRWNK